MVSRHQPFTLDQAQQTINIRDSWYRIAPSVSLKYRRIRTLLFAMIMNGKKIHASKISAHRQLIECDYGC
ncbi:MAG: hypothetical protein N2C12_01905, partial [Planctomycetales bacterium]